MDATQRKQAFAQAKANYVNGTTKPTRAIGPTPAHKPILGLYASIARKNLGMGVRSAVLSNATQGR
jgi:hypothetical protein